MRSFVFRRLLPKRTSKRKAAIKNHPDEGKDPEKAVAEVLQQRKGTENPGSIVNQYVDSAPSTACAENMEPEGGYRKKRRSRGEKKRKIIADPELGGISSQKKVCVVSSSFVDQSHINSEIKNVKLSEGEYRKTQRGMWKKKRKIIDSVTNPELGCISSQKKVSVVSSSYVDQSHLYSEIKNVKLHEEEYRKKRGSRGKTKRKTIDSITDPEVGGISSQKKVFVVGSSFVDQSHLNSEIRNVKLPEGEYRKTRRGRGEKKRKIIDAINYPELGGISSQKKVSPSFVDQSHLNSEIRNVKLPSLSSRKLIILDLNGLLADIRSEPLKGSKPDKLINHRAVYKRPFCDEFLQFSFETFDVAVWSSRNRFNVQQMLTFLMSEVEREKLIFTRDQSHCTNTGFMTMENKDKPIFLKELEKFWKESKVYNKSNTLLIDDSPYKALYNPPYTGIFPNTYECSNDKDDFLGPDGDLRLYLKKLAEADNVGEFVKENPFGQIPITDSHPSWDFYSKVIALKPPE